MTVPPVPSSCSERSPRATIVLGAIRALAVPACETCGGPGEHCDRVVGCGWPSADEPAAVAVSELHARVWDGCDVRRALDELTCAGLVVVVITPCGARFGRCREVGHEDVRVVLTSRGVAVAGELFA